jgi:polyhydroxyalkanoate synthase
MLILQLKGSSLLLDVAAGGRLDRRMLGTAWLLGCIHLLAGVINPPAKGKRSHWIGAGAALPAQAQEWFDKATEHPGSWWTDWAAWLKSHAGKQVPAPKALGNARYKPIEPAPGRYVKAKA